jgi:hypothetical protein
MSEKDSSALWKETMLLRLHGNSVSKPSQVQPESSDHLPCRDIDPALFGARQRLNEIAEEQRILNRKKQVLSKELKTILKEHPSLKRT